jgi:hypothetical protein
MENFTFIDYHQTRDFSRKMSATFEFVRQNFRSLGKSILFIAGPPVLVASMFMGSFLGDFFSASFNAGRGGNPNVFQEMFTSGTIWIQLAVMVVFLIVSSVATISTINNYIILYEEKRSNKIEVNDVWSRVRDSFWMYMGTAGFLTFLYIGIYMVMILIMALIGSIGSYFQILVFVIAMAFIVGLFYMMIGTSLVFMIRSYENIGVIRAIGRSLKLIKDKWWSTFGLLMILYFIAITVSYVFMIPWYAMAIVSSLHNTGVEGFQEPSTVYKTLTLVFFTLYYLAQMVLYSLPAVGLAFQYFNLVERKEARGLISRLESIGQAPASPSGPEEHY